MGKEDEDSRSGGGRGADDNNEEAVVVNNKNINSPSEEELLKQEEQDDDDEHVTLSSRPNVVSTHPHSTSDTVVSAITTPHGLLGDEHSITTAADNNGIPSAIVAAPPLTSTYSRLNPPPTN